MAVIRKVNETATKELFCVYFDQYVTGTMQLDKARQLSDWLDRQYHEVTISELRKRFAPTGITLWYASPLKQIF